MGNGRINKQMTLHPWHIQENRKKEGTRRIKVLLLSGSPVARKIIAAIKPYPVPHHAGSVRLPKRSACPDKGKRIFIFKHIVCLADRSSDEKKQIITVIKTFLHCAGTAYPHDADIYMSITAGSSRNRCVFAASAFFIWPFFVIRRRKRPYKSVNKKRSMETGRKGNDYE